MILLLNGSPNKGSMTLALSETLLKHTKEDYHIINCYDQKVISCNDCKFCDHKLACNKVDDMEEIYTLLEQANTLILSSPIYFGALSNELLKVINRFQRYFAQKFVHKKPLPISLTNMILVASAGSDNEKMFDGAKKTLDILSSLFQPKHTFFLQAKNTDHVSPLENQDLLRSLEEIKKRI